MTINGSHQIPVLAIGELGLVHCLGTAGIPVYTASEKEKNIASYSRYSKDHLIFSSYESQDFINELNEFGELLENRAVIMCHDDRAMLTISNHRSQLREHFLFQLPKAEMVEKILDKLAFFRLCEQYDLPAPASLEISSPGGLSAVQSKIKAPYIIKPPYRHYWYGERFKEEVGQYRKAFICQTFDELELMYGKIARINPSVLIQEYVVGDDRQMYDINLLVTEDGTIKSKVIAQKLRVYPPKAGWGSYVRTVFDDQMMDVCQDIIEKLGLVGMVNIQFKKDERSGKPKLIEIHTRTSIFDVLGAAAGQNVPAKYYQELTSPAVEPLTDYKEDVTYINLARDLRLLIRHRKEYDLSLWEWVRTYKNVSVFDGMTFKDPKVLYHELRSAFTR